MERYAIALDVGGTSLVSAVISSKGSFLKRSYKKTPVNSKGTSEEIITIFVRTLREALDMAEDKNLNVIGIGVGMPGPFNYKKGISLIKGVDKYESIYGMNLKKEFIKRLDLKEDLPIYFENDARTFLMGEAWIGEARGYKRVIGLTLGSGLGSAFMIDGKIVTEGQGVPPHGWIGGLPYDNGILDEVLSRRGIIARYDELTGNLSSSEPDVKEIACLAEKGDEISLKVFEEFGSFLGKVLKDIIFRFGAECLVIGGQISKSFPLFKKSLVQEVKSISSLRKVVPARRIDLSALYGEAKLVFQD
ncbi:MAG: ROK family protein [candidate division WOR-3 bacterium]|nr:ROK family protein [candidate division WOR-3 bacterium]